VSANRRRRARVFSFARRPSSLVRDLGHQHVRDIVGELEQLRRDPAAKQNPVPAQTPASTVSRIAA